MIRLNVITCQRSDEVLLKMIELEKGNKAVTSIPSNFSKHMHNICLIEDMLHFQYNGKHLVIVPHEIQSEIIKFSHCSYLSGHFEIQ